MVIEAGAVDSAVSEVLSVSARSLMARMRLFTLAFGRLDLAADPSLAGAAAIAQEFMRDRPRLSLAFPTGDAPPGFSSLLPMLVVVAAAALAKDGRVDVLGEIGDVAWRVVAAGSSIRLAPNVTAALAGEGAPFTPQNVVAAFAATLAARLGRRLVVAIDRTPNGQSLTIVIENSGLLHTGT